MYPKKIPVKKRGECADNYGDRKSQDHACRLAHGFPADHADDSSGNGGAGIDFSHKDIRGFTSHDISKDTAAHTSQHADKDKEERIVIGNNAGSCLYAYNREDSQTRGVADQHDLVVKLVFDLRIHDFRVGVHDGKEQGRCQDGKKDIHRFGKGSGRCNAQYDIPHHPAAYRSGGAQDIDAEDIHFLFNGNHGAGGGEGNGADDLQNKNKIIHSSSPVISVILTKGV